jgi:hypothetical protein
MRLLAHRGFWLRADEKNQPLAFRRALDHGFGIETDVRDCAGTLVISHDPPRGGEQTLDDFLAACAAAPAARPLALNVKADGLQAAVQAALQRHAIADAFVFDMAVPDALGYLRAGLPAYTRCSEYEDPPPFLERAAGIWLDGFHADWTDWGRVRGWLDAGKAVCLVSPELHGRPHQACWDALKGSGLAADPRFSLCTDFPAHAKEQLL